MGFNLFLLCVLDQWYNKDIRDTEEDKMQSLYRFISFPSFVNLVEHKKERYVNPCTWEDTCEGYLLQLLEKNDNIEEVLMELMNSFSRGNPEAAVQNYLKLWSARWLCYGQCWTTIPESDALWRIYSYDRMAIRIETDDDTVKALFANEKTSEEYSLRIDNVQYDLDANQQFKTRAELMAEVYNSKLITEPYYHKRKAFEHEHEKRIILLNKHLSGFYSEVPSRMLINNIRVNCKGKEISQEEAIRMLAKDIQNFPHVPYSKGKSKAASSIAIDIPDLKTYIKSVMVHPQAEEWIVQLIESICMRVGLNFKGKSQMYEVIS